MQYRFLIIAFLFYSNLNAQTNPQLRIKHLEDNFYIYTTYNDLNGVQFPSNGMFLVTPAGAILFDTPWDTSQLQPLLDTIRVRHHSNVVLGLATHFHNDRTACLHTLTNMGIATFSSKQTYELCIKYNEPNANSYFLRDTTFEVGGFSFETYYGGEGHSPDNIVIWFPRQKLLYGGCLIKSVDNNSLGNISDANIKAWPVTLKNIQNRFKKPRYEIPGHFSWENKGAIKHTIHLLKKMQ